MNLSKVLVISNDMVDSKMAGLGLRSFEIAKFLSNFHEVTLSAPDRTNLSNSNFRIVASSARELRRLVKKSDVIVLQGAILFKYPFIKESQKSIVVDLCTPIILEDLELPLQIDKKIYVHNTNLKMFFDQLLAGDFFICGNERQRDFWLGMLSALNRINPVNYDMDKTFRKTIDVVPFGLPTQPPKHTKNVLKGKYGTIKSDDKVILWGGGVWDWFDPLTLLRAMEIICQKRKDIKLFFMGVKHPSPRHPETELSQKTIRLSKELGLHNRHIFFSQWIPYDERGDYLCESDIGIIIHPNHIETRFSHRTRFVDYLWANLPIVTTRGGELSRLVEQETLGITVAYNDVESLARAILELLDNKEFYRQCKENLQNIAPQFSWDKVLKPLNEFCKNPRLAPDKKYLEKLRLQPWLYQPSRRDITYFANRLKYLYNEYGIKYTIKYCWQFFLNKLSITIFSS